MQQLSCGDADRSRSAGLAAIQAADGEAAARTVGQLLLHVNLPSHTRRLLCGHPDEIGRYATLDDAEGALIDQLVQAGCDTVEIANLLSTYPAAGVFAQRKARDPQGALLWLLDRANMAQQRISGRAAFSDSLATHLRAWAASIPRTRRAEWTDVSVLKAHIEMAVAASALTYTATTAALAQAAQVTTVTVRNVNFRLVARGLISVVEPGGGGKPAIYRLLAPLPGMESVGPPPVCMGAKRTVQDLFRSCGLGHLAGIVYQVLLEQPRNHASLVRRSGLTAAHVYSGLDSLVAVGSHASGQLEALAYQHKGVWYARPADLTQVAEVLFNGRWATQM